MRSCCGCSRSRLQAAERFEQFLAAAPEADERMQESGMGLCRGRMYTPTWSQGRRPSGGSAEARSMAQVIYSDEAARRL